MLTIHNIKGLVGKPVGNWQVVDAYECGHMSYLKAHHYCITFNRGSHGAAVLIDRDENRLLGQYHIYVCYENYDKVISETSWSKEGLEDKDEFFEMVTNHLDFEWNRNTNP